MCPAWIHSKAAPTSFVFCILFKCVPWNFHFYKLTIRLLWTNQSRNLWHLVHVNVHNVTSLDHLFSDCSSVYLSSSISRLDSLSDSCRHRASRRSISLWSFLCNRMFSSLIWRSSSMYWARFSVSVRGERILYHQHRHHRIEVPHLYDIKTRKQTIYLTRIEVNCFIWSHLQEVGQNRP